MTPTSGSRASEKLRLLPEPPPPTPSAKLNVTDHCPLQQSTHPLYIEGDHFTAPFGRYGKDIHCDRCGFWGVFTTVAKIPGPWISLGA